MATPQKANNYLVPATGNPQMVPVQGPFPAGGFQVDFRQISLNGAPFIPSGVFIDNTTGTAALTVTIQGVNYSIICPAGVSMQCQYPAPLDQIATVYSNGSGSPTVTFVDFPVIPFATPSASGGGSGTVAVSNLPATLGQKNMAGSASVVLASDQTAVPVSMSSTPASASSVYSVPGSNVSGILVVANANRKGLIVVNDSTATMYIILDSMAASASNYSVKLNPGDTYTQGRDDYAGEIRAIWSATDGNARVTEIA